MTGLPTGTVTFLFTDVEGSTRLLQQLKDAYAEVLIECRRLVRTAIQERGGQEVDTEGDAVFAAFPSARDALLASVTAQQRLLRHPWPDDAAVRVRMGLHTGEARVAEGGYVGMDVHRTARICAAAHGAQILVSDVTQGLVIRDLPDGVSLRDVGQHRLKDLAHPHRLFQVMVAGLPTDFPPIKSLNALPNNLPVQLTSFIGRGREIAEIKTMLATERLVTLTGAGGSGKTRLAVQVGADLLEQYPDGVWLVELAALADPALVPQTVASALGVPEQPGRGLTETLVDYVRSKLLLLLLDNCEHLLAACAGLADSLLRACPRLRILATSRESLGMRGETLYPVPSLSIPDPQRLPRTEDLVQYDAVRLLAERAAAAVPVFKVTQQNAQAVAHLCYRLDGIPLAIELAAARLKALAVEQVVARLDDRFQLLTGGNRTALPRQQTLRATMDWGYDLLSVKERLVLRRLSVFVGGWTLEAAETVCCGGSVEASDIMDLLARLVDKSLVLAETRGSEARYRLLETVRQYGHDRLLESVEAAAVKERHRDWCLRLAARAEPELRGTRQDVWLERLEREHDNLRAALEWSKPEGAGNEAGLRLAGSLWRFWEIRGLYGEGRGWLEHMLRVTIGASASARAKALNAAASLAWHFDHEGATEMCEESLRLWRQLGHKEGTASALHTLGLATMTTDIGRAITLCEESLALYRGLGDNYGTASVLHTLGIIFGRAGEYERSETVIDESLELRRQLGDKAGIAGSLFDLGRVTYRHGKLAAAAAFMQESLDRYRELRYPRTIAMGLSYLGVIARLLGDHERAEALHEECLPSLRELGLRANIAHSLNELGIIARHQGDNAKAAALFEESLTIRREIADKRGIAESLETMASLASADGRILQAVQLFGAADAIRKAAGTPLWLVERPDHDQIIATLRARLDEPSFAEAWAKGQAMTLEQAIEHALAYAMECRGR
jgi:predicted ATPase/class 3 adenylate cyclase